MHGRFAPGLEVDRCRLPGGDRPLGARQVARLSATASGWRCASSCGSRRCGRVVHSVAGRQLRRVYDALPAAVTHSPGKVDDMVVALLFRDRRRHVRGAVDLVRTSTGKSGSGTAAGQHACATEQHLGVPQGPTRGKRITFAMFRTADRFSRSALVSGIYQSEHVFVAPSRKSLRKGTAQKNAMLTSSSRSHSMSE